MTATVPSAARRPESPGDSPSLRIARSALATSGHLADLDAFHDWFTDCGRRFAMEVGVVPLDALAGWRTDPATGDLRHESGRFYAVTGLEVHTPGAPVSRWCQPILDQPEVGVLGILAKEFDGVLHFLMQAKNEPGNPGGLQLSPTVQATRSNFTRVHGGSRVPYLDHFLDASRHHVLADVRQSEQGAWFYRKRNRNMVVLVTEDLETLDGFCWLTLGQLHRLLAVDDLVNMDARTVLSCLPFAAAGLSDLTGGPAPDPFTAALVRSCEPGATDRQESRELPGWLSGIRSGSEDRVLPVPLRDVDRWRLADGRIVHEDGAFFSVMGVTVSAAGREVRSWSQPLIEPCDQGVCAFLVRQREGVLELLVQAKAQPGFVDTAELAPTVQCTPSNYDVLPDDARPPYLTEVLSARPEQIRFDTVLAEEGGRFFQARNRYLVVETGESHEAPRPGYRWVTMAQLSELLCHSHYLNVEARSLVACLHALSAGLRPDLETASRH
ncbi:NDP-hexose 2,3-dehydratase family protein [Streptomyces luteogriseus]|uniref:NDP-hexose 2,3-dehydratase family protein n=1 Tax=Streptomyces luteogriseus TaxID=68233 RepID=UPI002E3819FB|nr:NDP-hexose 2,3-dehydratase family protein [Streptomyces luteogriseus]WTJ32155.1 NDP-hexose 2,3-dehydratase family protein [Streptomyces luteogriseus]